MRILVYKRTHPGDPDNGGCFGAEDCMGAIRARKFDAVIGVGGIGAEPQRHGIDGKLNWIGIGPRRGRRYGRGPLLTFDQFRDFGTHGGRLISLAPSLARRIYRKRLRHLMSDSMSETELREVEGILSLARGAPASTRVAPFRRGPLSNGCRPICKPRC
jgi:hypothetical protein